MNNDIYVRLGPNSFLDKTSIMISSLCLIQSYYYLYLLGPLSLDPLPEGWKLQVLTINYLRPRVDRTGASSVPGQHTGGFLTDSIGGF